MHPLINYYSSGKSRVRRLLKKGLCMQREKLLRTVKLAKKLQEASEIRHEERIKRAAELVEVLNSFIAEEVQKATALPPRNPNRLSWEKVAKCLGISKTAAYTRYKSKS